VKRTRRDEPNGVIIHTCMETTQGNSLCSYLYLKLAKASCFSYYILCFFFYEIRKQKCGTGCEGTGGWQWWERGDGGERG
jgi:hypothetical protein